MRPIDYDVNSSSTAATGHHVAVTAPHGGNIEPYTDGQARRAAETLDCDMWVFESDDSNAWDRWHTTSSEISPSEFPGLDQLMNTRSYYIAVSFHGFSGDEIVIGGVCDLELRESVASQIGSNTSVVGAGTDSSPYSYIDGTSPDNYVNRMSDGEGGLQIEQPYSERKSRGDEIAAAVVTAIENYI